VHISKLQPLIAHRSLDNLCICLSVCTRDPCNSPKWVLFSWDSPKFSNFRFLQWWY